MNIAYIIYIALILASHGPKGEWTHTFQTSLFFIGGKKKKSKYKQKHSGGVQVQVRWNPEQSDLVGVNSIHGRGLELDDF